jgi:intracellular sulfur oxidation DsrE/DsrF family protein
MANTSRRAFAGAGGVGATLTATQVRPPGNSAFEMKKDSGVACVYHCDFGDPSALVRCSQHQRPPQHLGFDPFQVKIVVVAHGAGSILLDDRTGTAWENDRSIGLWRFAGLAKFGVEPICEITYKRQKIDMAKTRSDSFLKFVPSGVATVAALRARATPI